jgi:alcohol dehydrogenase (cytochrome c)
MLKSFLLSAVLALPAAFAVAEDWPQWQGPDRNAISSEKGLLQAWPENGPPLAWRRDGLGGGDSAPAVADGKLFGMSNRDGKEIVWALSEADGKELWVAPLGDAVEQGVPQSKEGPGGTPTVDKDRLYVIGMSGRVACLDVREGRILWQRSFTEEFGGVLPMWSYRESPLVDGDKVICTPGGPEATLVALNKLTGETLWKAVVPSATPSAAGTAAGQNPAAGRPGRPGNASGEGRPNRPGGGNNNAAPEVTGTKDPGLFLSEHWGMTKFTHKLPNGKYIAKLYFAETFAGITGAGGRVFSFNVEGIEFKDFDIWEKAGGPRKAYIETVPVEITDGEFQITFDRQTDNPAIKAIELIPDGKEAKDPDAVRIKAGQSAPFTDSNGNVWLADQGFEGVQLSPGFFNFPGGARPGGFGGRGGAGRSGAAYSSVIAIDFEGDRQFVQLTASSLVGVSAKDGKILWQYAAPANAMGINCSTPIFRDGIVFAASAYGNGGGAVKLSRNADGTIKAEEVYFSRNMQNHHGGMIVIDGALYGANGGNEGGFLTCMEFQTGKVLWRDREAPKGSLILADGTLERKADRPRAI